MLDRELLSAEHRELAAIAGRLADAVAADAPDVAAVAALRWRMRRVLASHLAKEDSLLYPRLRAGSDALVAATATRFADEMGGLAAAYRRYMSDWDTDRIAAEWQAFGAETRTVLAALERRITREEGELYPLLHRHAQHRRACQPG